jgi:hypothetical protein
VVQMTDPGQLDQLMGRRGLAGMVAEA